MIEALIRPLHPPTAALCAGLALLVALLYRPGIPGALLHVLALLVVLRYGCAVIERGAWNDGGGHASPDWRAFNQGFEQPFKLIGVIAFFALVHGAVVYRYGETAGWPVLLVLNLAAPACVVIIALGHSFVDALNPRRVAAVIARTGFDYAAACFVLALLSVAGNLVLDILLATAAPAMRLFLYSFCSYYYVLAVFFMMAWLVARHRHDLVA